MESFSSARCQPSSGRLTSAEPPNAQPGSSPAAAGESTSPSKAKPSSGVASQKTKINSSKAKPTYRDKDKSSSKTKVKPTCSKAKPNCENYMASKAKPNSDSKSKSMHSRIDNLESMLSVLMERLPGPLHLHKYRHRHRHRHRPWPHRISLLRLWPMIFMKGATLQAAKFFMILKMIETWPVPLPCRLLLVRDKILFP